MGSGKGKNKRIRNAQLINNSPDIINFSLPNVRLISEDNAAKKLRILLSEIESRNKQERLNSDKYFWELASDLSNNHKFIGNGNYKSAFDGGEVIYKIPAPHQSEPRDALMNLLMEASLSINTHDGHPVAKSQLVWHESGLPILIMEKLDTNITREDKPSWALLADGGQVGKNKTGELVFYDMDLSYSNITNKEDWIKENPPLYPGNTYDFVKQMRK